MFALESQEQILDKLNTLIIVLNNDGSVDYVSKSAQQMLGYKPNDLLGYKWWETPRFSKPEGIEIKNKLLNTFKQNHGETQSFEHVLKTAFGGQKWFRWNVSYLNDEQLIGIGYDVTDKKQSEKRLLEQNKKLLEQNKNITDSIFYAQRIQQSVLRKPEYLKEMFNESFLMYKPKDIVSGDYYWFYENDLFKYVAVVDCTGHGVPGAMMSIIADSVFKEVFVNKKITCTREILHALDEALYTAINKNGGESRNDGMDIALISVNKTTNEFIFSGALRPVIISGKDGLTELKGSRYPIGFYSGIDKNFESVTLQLKENDCLYLFSDGFIDQFGGERNKKLNKSNFKELLSTIYDMPMEEQESFLEYAFNNWKQNEEQTDDVLVIGIRV